MMSSAEETCLNCIRDRDCSIQRRKGDQSGCPWFSSKLARAIIKGAADK